MRQRFFLRRDAQRYYAKSSYNVCLPKYVHQQVRLCECEKYLSMLGRVNTCLRNSQSQKRMNHFMVLMAHCDIARIKKLDNSQWIEPRI